MSALPFDPDGYLVSFLASEGEAARAFLDTHGLVAMRDVLDDAAIERTLEAFFSRAAAQGLRRDDPGSWAEFWSRHRLAAFGIVGMLPDFDELEQLRNRTSAGVHAAYAAALGTEALWVDHDRLGVMAPQLKPDGSPSGAPSTRERWLHLDCNPTSEGEGVGHASIGSFDSNGAPVDFRRTFIPQSLLTLTDARVEDGGFHCVPGSHTFSIEWVKAHPEAVTNRSNVLVPKDDPLQAQVVPVPLRKGCLLVWSSLLFHGNRPNASHRMRAVQYLRMVPTSGTPYRPLMARDPHWLPKGFVRTPVSDALLGF